jgi:uncharacterized membrane protein YkvI
MKKSYRAFRIGMLIVATIIGAGFASGRELVAFFGKFGYAAIPIAALCAVLMFLSTALFMAAGNIIKPNTIEEFNRAIFGKFSPIIDFVLLFNYLMVLATMLAGTDSLFDIFIFENKLPFLSVITAILTFVVVYKGFDVMLDVNAVLVPIILYMTFIISIFSLSHPVPYEMTYSDNIGLMLFYTAIYVSMNIILSSGVITTIKLPLKDQIKGVASGSAIIGFFIAVLTAAIMCAGLNAYNSAMPVMEIASRMNMSFVAGIIIWSGIFTTILTSVYTLNSWTQSFIKNKALSLFLILAVGLLISRLGFKNIVDSFYPISGAIGLLYIIAVLIFYLKTQKRLKNQKTTQNQNQ